MSTLCVISLINYSQCTSYCNKTVTRDSSRHGWRQRHEPVWRRSRHPVIVECGVVASAGKKHVALSAVLWRACRVTKKSIQHPALVGLQPRWCWLRRASEMDRFQEASAECIWRGGAISLSSTYIGHFGRSALGLSHIPAEDAFGIRTIRHWGPEPVIVLSFLFLVFTMLMIS